MMREKEEKRERVDGKIESGGRHEKRRGSGK